MLRRTLLALLSVGTVLAFWEMPVCGGEPGAIEIGGRRELLVDHLLIDRMDGVRLVLNRPRDEGAVIQFDQPWEGLFCGYSTIIKDGERFMAYYRGRPEAGADGDPGEVYCLAESSDGIHWSKPQLETRTRSQNSKARTLHVVARRRVIIPLLDELLE